MAKSSRKTKEAKCFPCDMKAPAVPTKFVDRDLCKVNPLKEQFEPTDAMPVRNTYKMAGGA